MKRLIAAIHLSVAGLAAPALAEVPDENCFVRVRPDTTLVRLIYDPFEGVRETEELQLSFTPRMKGCTFGLAVGGLGSGTERYLQGNGKRLSYELQIRGANVRNDLNQPSVTVEPNPGRGPKDAINQVRSPFEMLKVVVPSAQFAPAGSYRDDVTLRMFKLVSGVPQQIGEDQQLSIIVDIPARAQINLAGSNSPVFGGVGGSGLDFGELEQGKKRDAYIQVRATSPVILTLSSEHRGVLLHKVEKTSVPAIPYALTIDDEQIDLSSGSTRIDKAPTRGLGADNYRMVARILEVNDRVAGEYGDLITVTVEPK